MGGAQGLAAGWLQGSLLINLDTEAWGEFYLGCATGVDVNVRHHYVSEAVPEGYCVSRLEVKGLRGGHSGVDIHLERGNANKLLVRLVRELEQLTRLRVAGFQGGNARNALAREAHAVVAYPVAATALVESYLRQFEDVLRQELAGVDEAVSVRMQPAVASTVMSAADQHAVFAALHAAPHGVKRMSQSVLGVVETSNNLGVVTLGDDQFFANLMVRSLLDSGAWMLAREIEGLFQLLKPHC
ncbi:peptidase dimerization domain-containing protein [Paludibacterium denitrificans]|uniref:peptidase dimerization domain-containing protein n=1 Tax=Paludibacterium denitrificans TaxID=2675226 RepID=UPI001E570612|nr:peptidase dimerization domain-containing protein [Paludibacterium denitrificans]